MDAVAEVKARLNIEDVVSEYVQLKRAGRNFKGLSPWTNEKTPSFIVSPEKQIWHDFSSSKGGDMFSFVMEMEGLDFRGTLEHLARKAGVDLEQYQTGGSSRREYKSRALEALALAARFYQRQLAANKTALKYLIQERAFSKKTLLDWQLGYAPKASHALTDFLTKQGFDTDEMKRAGLTTIRSGRPSDMFHGRIMIPLADSRGAIIGFTARLLADEPDAPKYINTPQTVVYDKSRHVFGLHLAKEAIRKSGFGVIVEGNLDVIASHQAGVANVVATAGTAMTENHLRELKRFTGDIRLCFDTDSAGVSATERAITMAQKTGVSLSVTVLDDAKDPDELIRKDAAKWQKAVQKSQYAMDWLIDRYSSELDLKSAPGKKAFTDALLTVVRRLNDAVEQDHYLKKLAQLTDSSLDAMQAKFSSQKAEKTILRKVRVEPATVDRASVEQKRLQDHFLAILVMQPKLRDILKDCQPEYFSDGLPRKLFNILREDKHFPSGDKAKLQALHLDATQGAGEQQTEAYLTYVEGAAQPATPRSAKNLEPEDGSAGRQAEVVQSLQDYVKILVLQFEELYQDLPLEDLKEQAQNLKNRLIARYVKTQKQQLSVAMQSASDEKELEKLINKADKLNELIR
ncbi:MAG TPA: DNA primase [Candidatus Saccharimonadales bacterium]|nr:DNA primase [Candidatus Saccharimonadales bacterium]